MIKLISQFLVVLSFITAGVANATLITADLTENNYINYKGLDWAWASPVNVEVYGSNRLYSPTLHEGWRFASENELIILKTELTLQDFTGIDGSGNEFTIQAIEYWNTHYVRFNIEDFNNDWVNSSWTITPNIDWNYETFYVRDTPSDVPEPSTILIFAIALIALSLRKRAIK
ncbi:hypothetical protein A3Q34_11910 [Colwellia sp. PAMC 20917]|uniref:PEP-CTERM sorting domain-containing protein n=1 Tax=Colwellia sp. PAMC 20917 TaxID=1816218 RepID=UPI00087868C1|nr:PEP-CTERM sorting domain-containing protein [Colwellia sp. PAMC 20917]AOW77500.1 hypothetical protein A3Q34_11910 [Colwellia sp. PAMC 20917]